MGIFADRLIRHGGYRKRMSQIADLEKDRIYCRHDMTHVLEVSRLAWMLYLEEQLGMSGDAVSEEECRGLSADLSSMEEMKDRIYVAGLLHDIGRASQYLGEGHHAETGAEIAQVILTEIGFPEPWKEETVSLIRQHGGRKAEKGDGTEIGTWVNRADHLSRTCFLCEAADTCKWSAEEKNTKLW